MRTLYGAPSGIASNGDYVRIVWSLVGLGYDEYYVIKSQDITGETGTWLPAETWPQPDNGTWYECYFPGIAYDDDLGWVMIGTVDVTSPYMGKDVAIVPESPWREYVEILAVAASADDAEQTDTGDVTTKQLPSPWGRAPTKATNTWPGSGSRM